MSALGFPPHCQCDVEPRLILLSGQKAALLDQQELTRASLTHRDTLLTC